MKLVTRAAHAAICALSFAGAAHATTQADAWAEIYLNGATTDSQYTSGLGSASVDRGRAFGGDAQVSGTPTPSVHAHAYFLNPVEGDLPSYATAAGSITYDVYFKPKNPISGELFTITNGASPIGRASGSMSIFSGGTGEAIVSAASDYENVGYMCTEHGGDCNTVFSFDIGVGSLSDLHCSPLAPCELSDRMMVGRLTLGAIVTAKAGSMRAAVDPVIRLNPEFFAANGLNASDFTVQLDPGVGNSGGGAVPEPGTWLMTILGLFVLGARLRRWPGAIRA